MNDETIIKPEYKKEFVAAFKKLTMSGAVGADAAIAKLIKNNPGFFYLPTNEDIEKLSRDEMNADIRRRAQPKSTFRF